MAITASVPANASSYDTTGGTSDATGSWTPSGNTCTYIAFVHGVAGGGSDPPSVSGNSLTWTNITSVEFDSIASPVRRTSAFRASGIATAGATTASFASESQAAINIVVVEVEGTDPTTNDGVVQSATARADSGTAESVALAAFGSATNATLSCWTLDTNMEITEEATHTELSSGIITGPNTAMNVSFLATADTSPTATGADAAWAGIALELAEDDGGEAPATTHPGWTASRGWF